MEGEENCPADATAYAYTLQGWLSEASSPTYGEVLRYASPSRAATSVLPGKAGLVTEWTSWQKGSLSSGAAPQSETCAFAYDGTGRLMGSTRYAGNSSSPLTMLTERDITYDESGSLLSLRRYGSTSGTVPEDSLSFVYAGTRRTGYGYDAYGNVTDDPVSGTTIRWNVIGLPRTLSDGTEMTRRAYAADGTLLAVYEGSTGTEGRVYEGSLVLSRSAAGVLSVESAGWEGGRILPGTGAEKHLYQVTDHLGSVRAVRDGAGTVLQRLDYYPFGSVSRSWRADEILEAADPVEPGPVGDILPDASPAGAPEGQLGEAIPVVDVIPVSVTVAGSAQRYRFSGKEIAGPGMGGIAPAGTVAATAAATPYLDFGARLYDPRTASWLSQDPLSEKYYSISPYVYCVNSPLNVIDPLGLTYYWVNGEMVEINDGYFDSMEVTEHEYEKLQRCFAKSDQRYLNLRTRLMDRNGYVDSEGTPVLAASRITAEGGLNGQFNWLDAGISFLSSAATETGRFLYNPDTQRWFSGKLQVGTYGMGFYGNQYTWKQKNVIKAGRQFSGLGKVLSVIGIGKQIHYKYVEGVIIPQYEMGILGYPSTMPFK